MGWKTSAALILIVVAIIIILVFVLSLNRFNRRKESFNPGHSSLDEIMRIYREGH